MSLLINGMEMPTAGMCKSITIFDYGAVVVANGSERLGIAISVPEHGRLKDYDAIYAEYKKWFDNAEYRDYKSMFFALWNAFNFAPIIIPGEEEPR